MRWVPCESGENHADPRRNAQGSQWQTALLLLAAMEAQQPGEPEFPLPQESKGQAGSRWFPLVCDAREVRHWHWSQGLPVA